MKSRSLPTLTLIVIVCLSVQALAAPRSYPLRVRGGGRLRVTAENTRTPSLVKLIVEFESSGQKAGAGLRPGQGSWMDRELRAGEPARLEYYLQEGDAKKIIDYMHSPGNYYTFDCYNSGKGYLQVTKAYVKSVRID